MSSRQSGGMLLYVLLAAVVHWTASTAQSQNVCNPSSGSSEARLLAFSAVPLAFASAMPKPSLAPGDIAIGLELTGIPAPSAAIQRSDECFVEKGQNTQLSRVLPRPRLGLGLPGGVTAEVSYLPPVTVADATPSLFGFALGYSTRISPSLGALVRVHGTVGYIDGPVTCARSALQADPAQPCFGTEPSKDRYAPNAYGVELMVSRAVNNRVNASLGLGASHLRPRFTVGFTNGLGFLDNTRVEQNFTRATALADLSALIVPRLRMGAQLYAVAQDGATVRLTTQWNLR